MIFFENRDSTVIMVCVKSESLDRDTLKQLHVNFK